MCGLVGFVKSPSAVVSEDLLHVERMAQRIQHRGPDGEGVWCDQNSGVFLAHRRLSIQDLSSSGAQPMVSPNRRWVLVFNGEIYNFNALRDKLIPLGYKFSGHSDTEVMLGAFDAWGVEEAIKRFVGMFAFALLDRLAKKLYLVRDRLGEKPLYFGLQQNVFVFGSELKALKAHPCWIGDIDKGALALLLRHNYIPAPHSIYSGIQKLPPGTLLELNLNGSGCVEVEREHRYWRLEQYCGNIGSLDVVSASMKLEALMRQAIRDQMISDVPIGAFLSGGIDSSAIVALMQQESARPVKTFSIGFHEDGFNEASHARDVATHLRTDHRELYVTAQNALDVIPILPRIYDEPFADSSQIPTYLLSQMAREEVTVALSGDGGDELFCGYERFFQFQKLWRTQQQEKLQSGVKRLLAQIPAAWIGPWFHLLHAGSRGVSLETINEKISRKQLLWDAGQLQCLYRTGISYWDSPDVVMGEVEEAPSALRDFNVSQWATDPLKQLMLLDTVSYLPDDILVKVDRAAMASSLETRIPLLDHRIVEFAAALPSALNVAPEGGKQVLRSVLYRHVPRALIERPKQGFAVPIGVWLRTSLRDWAESLLEPTRLASQGFFKAETVRRYWLEHLKGIEDHSFKLWGILMFQAWYDYQQ